MKNYVGCFTVIFTCVALFVFMPVLYYFGGWVTGKLLGCFIGDIVINGFNYLFGTTRFTVENLPMMCGTLGVIGSFFKNYNYNSKD